MELNILYAIQSIHNPVLDRVMVTVFNTLVGSMGQLWIVVGLVLLIIPKTRKCGAAVLLSFAVSFLIGNEFLKDMIARPRPCAVDSTIPLIVKKSTSFSCPSVHTYLAFSSAMAIFHYHKKAGIGVFVFAAMVGFSRMYFFVHYPTDVLFGVVLGIATAFVVCMLLDKIYGCMKRKSH
ncbi:MAG: phosphatase PAP2 family protein [Lachnospiraceae bacterium]|nr:phosphatase PAP2 family protein [Lachnospiraceae bacterium]